MKNDQPHTLERKYVTIKIRKCSETLDGPEGTSITKEEAAKRGKVCKSDEEIETLLKSTVFTYYMATGVA